VRVRRTRRLRTRRDPPSFGRRSPAERGSWFLSGPEETTDSAAQAEEDTRRQLERILESYDVSAWLMTNTIEIDQDAIPHSHPRPDPPYEAPEDDLLLLATNIHEQSHWYFEQRARETALAVSELKALFPHLPVGYPDGANDIESSYLHLAVIAFEQRGLRRTIGELSARQVMEFWATDHYRALYRTVLENERQIWTVLDKHGLRAPARK
jgi:hypothetical protein